MARSPASSLRLGPATPPGAFRQANDRWGRFPDLLAELRASAVLVVVDREILALHPSVARALRATHRSGQAVACLELPAGERIKSLDAVGRILRAGLSMPRSGLVLAIGGGSIGDVATVAAHLLKRGVGLIHVPTTLLAAVDSSIGGKGAVHLMDGKHAVKNAAGVFHYPSESWVCEDLFESLSEPQLFEGRIEAYKMAACLDAAAWRRYRRREPGLAGLIRDARALKNAICAADPYEERDQRRLLNFGHTFGHVFESLTHFELSHGDAVCLGICCALDVGRKLGVTSERAATEIEQGFGELWRAVHPGKAPRAALAAVLDGVQRRELARLLATDKKADSAGRLRMALVTALGQSGVFAVESDVWTGLWKERWRSGGA